MAHRVLALKYRPQTFADLVGQEHVSSVLAAAIAGGRVAQAYLFTGARGVGKTTSARILAKALNCERRGTNPDAVEPCDVCTSCREIVSGVSLDVAEIDGASNRGIADVQALREKVRFAPTGGRHRVVIIDEVHQLSNDAFAALLKTLEEPPAHLVFLFATTDPQKLPDTIRSRTQRFDFARVPLRKVAARLQDIAARERADADGARFELTEGAALLIAQKSEGSMRDAVSALDQVVSSGEPVVDEALVRRVLGIPDREVFFTLVGAIVRREPRAALEALHAAFDRGIDPGELQQGITEHIRHLLVLKVDPEAADLVPVAAEDLDRLKTQAGDWPEHDLLRLMRLAADLGWPMRDSAQPLIHLEAAVLQMATLESGETLGQLLARLDALEQRLGGPGMAGTGGAGSAATGPPRAAAAPRSAPAAPAARPPASTGPRPVAQAPSPAAPPRPSAPERPPAAAKAMPGPPASAVAPSAAAVLDEEAPFLDADVLKRWERVVEAVNARKRMLGAFLQESQFQGVTARDLVIGMDDLHRSVVAEAENRGLVEREAEAVFGRRLELRCAAFDSTVETQRPKEDDMRPMVDRAIEWFAGDAVQPAGRRVPGSGE